MTKVLYTGAFRFPEGDAAAARVYAVGQLFERIHYSVSFAGWERPQQGNGYYRYKGHDCYSQSEFRDRDVWVAARLLGFFFRGIKTLKWLWHNPDYDIVVAYNPPVLFSIGLLLTGWAMGFRVVLDSTEWYDSAHLPGGRFGFAAGENWVRMRLVYLLFRHVICISQFLEQHFAGRNVVNIPPLAVVPCDILDKPPIGEGIAFIYAGEAGNKDRLLVFIQALPEIQRLIKRPVLMRIAGMDWEALCQLIKNQNIEPAIYKPLVECFGRISRESVKCLYDISHFSILFRDNKRYANAGFPTKAVESWSYGCPIITNPVGDLGLLARDMVDAIVLDETSIAKCLPMALREIVDGNHYSRMSLASSVKARQIFTFDSYSQEFGNFAAQLDIKAYGR